MKRLAAALEHKVPPPLDRKTTAAAGPCPCTGCTRPNGGRGGGAVIQTCPHHSEPVRPRTHRKHCLLRNIPFKPQPHVLGYGLHTYRVDGVVVAGAGCARGGAFRRLDNAFPDYSRRAGSHPEIRYRIPAVPPAGTALGIAQHLPKLCMAGLRTYILPTETLNGSGTH